MSALRYHLAGAKGGQGTTTIALVLAALAAEARPTTLVATRPGDAAALAAARPAWPALLADGLALTGPNGPTVLGGGVVVEDLGAVEALRAPERAVEAPNRRRWLVVRGPCFLALRAALEAPWRPDGVVLVTEPGRALSAADVADVLGVPVVADVPLDPALARAADAGLLLAQLHRLAALRRLGRLVANDLAAGDRGDGDRAGAGPGARGPHPGHQPTDHHRPTTTDQHPDHDHYPNNDHHPDHQPPTPHPATTNTPLQQRETSSTDYAASSKLPPSGCRNGAGGAGALAWLASGRVVNAPNGAAS